MKNKNIDKFILSVEGFKKELKNRIKEFEKGNNQISFYNKDGDLQLVFINKEMSNISSDEYFREIDENKSQAEDALIFVNNTLAIAKKEKTKNFFPYYDLLSALLLRFDFDIEEMLDIIKYYVNYNSELLNSFEEEPNDSDELKFIIENTKIINDLYFKNIANYSSSEVDSIINAFKKLKLDSGLCYNIKKKILKDLRIRNKKQLANDTTIKSTKTNIKRCEIKKEGIITEKEYQEIRKYLNQYIDIYKLDLKFDTITEQERDYIATLLFKLGEDKDVVRQFLIKTEELVEKEDLNPSEKFQKDYKKYEYYKEKYGLADDIDTINNLCLMLEDEKDIEMRDYIEKEIEKLLQNINMKIPKYGYELKVLNDDKNNVYIKK